MPHLYLHIGYPKTGTTSLQKFFSENASQLKTHGVLYPETGRLNNAHYAINFGLKIGSYDGPVRLDPADILREKLLEEVRNSGCDTVLVSSEYFAAAKSPAIIREYFLDYNVTVVVYLRRHDHAFESTYYQAIKSTTSPPWEPSIESFILYQLGISTVSYDYLRMLRKWAAAFGAECIEVRPFERSQIKPDLCSNFLQRLNIDAADGFVFPNDEENASLSPQIATVIDAVQRSTVSADTKRLVVGSLVQIDSKLDKTMRARRLSPAVRTAIISFYRHSYSIIAREFMAREDGVLFEEPYPDPKEEWLPTPQPSTQEAIDLVLRAMQRVSAK